MKKKIYNLLINLEFDKAKIIIDTMNKDEASNILFDLAIEKKGLLIYSFLYYIISNSNHINTLIEHHTTITFILTFPTIFINDFYKVGLFHAKRVFELTSDIELREYLLNISENPDIPLTSSDISNITNEILQVDPCNKTALMIKKNEKKISVSMECNSLVDIIYQMEFKKIFSVANKMNNQDLIVLLIKNKFSLVFYTFLYYMFERTNDIKYHIMIAILLLKKNNIIRESESGLFHLKEFLIKTNNIDLELLLYFFSIIEVIFFLKEVNFEKNHIWITNETLLDKAIVCNNKEAIVYLKSIGTKKACEILNKNN